jgi:asparagine synthase (glutamine-hydrolysing)
MFIAARDSFGIKPLYWTVHNGRLLFSAEMKAFLPFGWDPEWDVKSLMEDGWIHDGRTIFKSVNKVRKRLFLTE